MFVLSCCVFAHQLDKHFWPKEENNCGRKTMYIIYFVFIILWTRYKGMD